jgi:hypothetical protein
MPTKPVPPVTTQTEGTGGQLREVEVARCRGLLEGAIGGVVVVIIIFVGEEVDEVAVVKERSRSSVVCSSQQQRNESHLIGIFVEQHTLFLYIRCMYVGKVVSW